VIDIIGFTPEGGMQIYDTQTERAANILSVQLDSLEYLPGFGIDLKYFLTAPIQFQNDGFKGYLIQTLASRGINVASMTTVLNALSTDYNFKLSPQEVSTGLVAR